MAEGRQQLTADSGRQRNHGHKRALAFVLRSSFFVLRSSFFVLRTQTSSD
jgi:hypothetical protein